MSWNISIENGQATINLSVEQDAAGRALIAATAAEAAASNAETASTQAGESASESAASATAAGQSATNALSSEQAAASSASQAAGSATAASSNATAAGQSASEAESSATAATGSATAAAQSETNAATSATEASQSATESAASATAAGQSATEAAASESVATAQAVIAVTKAGEASQSASEALASAQAAAQSEVDAEAARNEIVSKIDFTGAQEGDIYRVNSAGVAVRIKESDFIRNLYRISPLNSYFNTKNIFAWDNADKDLPDRTVLTELDSGQSWQSFLGPQVIAYSPSFGGSFSGDFGYIDLWSSVFPLNIVRDFGIEWSVNRSNFGTRTGLIIAAKDSSNFFTFERFMADPYIGGLSQGNDWRLISVVNGVGSSLGSISNNAIYGGYNNDGFESTQIEWVVKFGYKGRNGYSRILIFLKQNPSIKLEVDITSIINATYPNLSDLNLCGLCGDSQGNSYTRRLIVSYI